MNPIKKCKTGGLLLGLFLIFQAASGLSDTARLAILVENPTVASAADLLTAELSKNERVNLLEREQIDQILREQKLSAAGVTGKDFLKLGQVLGADGLLLLDVAKVGTNSFLNARLIAVKQGVVLDFLETPLPLTDAAQFSEGAAKRFSQFIPKLTVLTKDAVPISILNLRSAANSKESTQTERDLTLLLINRLSREREVFVLERRRMDALSSEKDLKADTSPFWNGSYLLEGIIDKDGFSKEQVTVSARVSPPNGGVPIQIELAGKRTDLPTVVDELAKKILKSLQKASSAPEWTPAEEAAQFFDEAKWALRWGMVREAQSAADSAWALGKRDLDAALIRVQSYWIASTFNSQIFVPQTSYDSTGPTTKVKRSFKIVQPPDLKKLDSLLTALNLYYQFSQTMPTDEPKFDSAWYVLGVNVLDAAGAALQHFYFVPKARISAAEKLADARALARAISAWLVKIPSVRGIYWVDDWSVTSDEFRNRLQNRSANFYATLAGAGRFWQEQPEDCVALYRELMTGEGYPYIRKILLEREPQMPMLIAWNANDQRQATVLWKTFLQELNSSTNLALRIEAGFQQFAETKPDKEEGLEPAFDALMATILTNREALLQQRVELIQLSDLGDLISSKYADIQTPTKERIKQRYYSDYQMQLRSLHDEFGNRFRAMQAFAKQKKFLEQKKPYNFIAFSQTFSGSARYSEEQARELQPLLASYKSDFTSQLEGKSGREKAQLQSGVSQIQSLEKRLESTFAGPAANKPSGGIVIKPIQYPEPNFDPTTNTITAKRFFKIPVERLNAENLRVFAHRYSEGKVLLDLRYEQAGQTGGKTFMASVGIWNPKNELADFIPYPDGGNDRGYIGSNSGEQESGLRMEIFKEAIYVAGWNDIQRFDLKTRQWQLLAIPVQTTAQLFVVNGRLFAATGESILELLDGGQNTRLLASIRRRPPASALDSLDGFGTPTLFPGPDGSVRTWIGKIYTWNKLDWTAGEEIPVSNLPRVFEDGTFFQSVQRTKKFLWFLPHHQKTAELCLVEPVKNNFPGIQSPTVFIDRGNTKTNSEPRPTWENTEDFSLVGAALATLKSNLYFFTEHVSVTTNAAGQWTFEAKDGRHANLICLDREFSKPLVVPLRFDLNRGEFASQSLSEKIHGWVRRAPYWLVFTPEDLIIGQGNMPGCWIIPRSEIESVLAVQKQIQRHGNLEKAAEAQKRKQDLLAKYDIDRDGIFSPSEKEKIINDPAWFEDQWPFIDTNENSFLDAGDKISWFDANENGTAEVNELLAMEKIQKLVAEKLVQRFDANRDGFLDGEELRLMAVRESENSKAERMYFSYSLWNFHDKNHDRRLDKTEFESMLVVLTRNSIFNARPLRPDMRPGMPAVMLDWEKEATKALYKTVVEYFWQQNKTKSSTAK